MLDDVGNATQQCRVFQHGCDKKSSVCQPTEETARMARALRCLHPSAWVLVLCALLWSVSPARSAPLERYEEWNSWKTTHGRLYGTGQEESRRHSIWLENMLYIEEHNSNAEKHGFTLKMNAFGDLVSHAHTTRLHTPVALWTRRVIICWLQMEEEWSQSQRCHKISYMNESRSFGTIPIKEKHCQSLSAEGELPESLDWREHDMVSDVKDQVQSQVNCIIPIKYRARPLVFKFSWADI